MRIGIYFFYSINWIYGIFFPCRCTYLLTWYDDMITGTQTFCHKNHFKFMKNHDNTTFWSVAVSVYVLFPLVTFKVFSNLPLESTVSEETKCTCKTKALKNVLLYLHCRLTSTEDQRSRTNNCQRDHDLHYFVVQNHKEILKSLDQPEHKCQIFDGQPMNPETCYDSWPSSA